MTEYTNGILHELRRRLVVVQRRIEHHERTTLDDGTAEYLHSAGALCELRSEKLFLTGMIAEIEKVSA